MTKKELLEYRGLKREIEQCKKIMGEMRMDIASPKAVRVDGLPHGSRKEQDPLAAAIARYIERSQEYADKVDAYSKRCHEIEFAIDCLPQLEREVCRYRYIMGWAWQMIARKVHLSESRCMQIHRQALVDLEDIEDFAVLDDE